MADTKKAAAPAKTQSAKGQVLMDKAEAQRIHEENTRPDEGQVPDWDNARKRYSDDDGSIDARMWRLERDLREQGAR
jgi:hypothetical protein